MEARPNDLRTLKVYPSPGKAYTPALLSEATGLAERSAKQRRIMDQVASLVGKEIEFRYAGDGAVINDPWRDIGPLRLRMHAGAGKGLDFRAGRVLNM